MSQNSKPSSSPPQVLMDPAVAKSIATLKELADALAKAQHTESLPTVLADLLRHAQGMVGLPAMHDRPSLHRMAVAFADFLKELAADPKLVTYSTVRTVRQVVVLLAKRYKTPSAKERGAIEAAHVLVVDDDAVAREMIRRAAGLIHLKPDIATRPLEALEFVQGKRYDLFVLDVNMPEMSGYELCQKLRALPAQKNAAIIFVTSETTMDSRLNFEKSGANDFVSKPFLPQELAAKMLLHLLDD